MDTTPAQPLTDEQVLAIEARWKAATPGPWCVFDGWEQWPHKAGRAPRALSVHAVDTAEPTICHVAEPSPEDTDVIARELANTAFIAHAPSDIDYLLQKVRNLETSSKGFEKLLAQSQQDTERLDWWLAKPTFFCFNDRADIDAAIEKEVS